MSRMSENRLRELASAIYNAAYDIDHLTLTRAGDGVSWMGSLRRRGGSGYQCEHADDPVEALFLCLMERESPSFTGPTFSHPEPVDDVIEESDLI